MHLSALTLNDPKIYLCQWSWTDTCVLSYFLYNIYTIVYILLVSRSPLMLCFSRSSAVLRCWHKTYSVEWPWRQPQQGLDGFRHIKTSNLQTKQPCKHICKQLKQHLIVLFDFKELIYTASFSSLLTMTVWFPCWFSTSVSTPWAQQSYLLEGFSEWRCVSMSAKAPRDWPWVSLEHDKSRITLLDPTILYNICIL